MHLLIVEGNSREIWQKREKYGGVPYHKRFMTMLKLLRPDAHLEVAFPADDDAVLPSVKSLRKFDGILWTGSSLYVNDPVSCVQQQLTFTEDVFVSGVPFYGSCWGLQLAVVVAGGKVSACPKGREFGISAPVELTEAGKRTPYLQGRNKPYSALCIHMDEVVDLPENSTILAGNSHSKVQALTIKNKNSEFFGVQYHPEFKISDMIFIARYMSEILINDGVFASIADVEKFVSKLEKKEGLPESITNYLQHIQEVNYWLQYLMGS
ncbi:MAG: type 1 glutamine amidotransferase [Cytophagales bacterium]|nr:type 1 glutamine amidotransferase [Cytophagales bacterium]